MGRIPKVHVKQAGSCLGHRLDRHKYIKHNRGPKTKQPEKMSQQTKSSRICGQNPHRVRIVNISTGVIATRTGHLPTATGDFGVGT